MNIFFLLWRRERAKGRRDAVAAQTNIEEVEDTSKPRGLAGLWSRAELDGRSKKKRVLSELADTSSLRNSEKRGLRDDAPVST